ncbi:MAG: hypothetical protein M1819_004790 [Sarea resinae]|nr:MAG: hypothetical protein M1819_004790 [Sarea resinae]
MAADCANPLLLEWLGEWMETARQRNSKGVTTYKKAYDSMKACPLTFSHPSEAQQLHGVGPKLCERLAEKLKAHCAENGLPMPEPPAKARGIQIVISSVDVTNFLGRKHGSDEDGTAGPAKKTRKPKPYVPTLRSGAYALIIALSSIDENSPQGLTKPQTIELAQPHCDSSFTAPSDPTKFYTAWNSMKTLLDKDLVYERGRPLRKYALTEDGWDVSKRIKATATGSTSTDRLTKSKRQPLQSQAQDSISATASGASAARQKFPPPNPKLYSIPKPIPIDDTFRAIDDFDEAFTPEPQRRGGDDEFAAIFSDPPEPLPGGNATQQPTLNATNTHRTTVPAIDKFPPDFRPIILPPSSFSVQLILDNREVRSTTDRDYISEELIKKGVKPITRSLDLGDALWVAKADDPSLLSRHGEEGDEIVLDWIVERKRLDDLVGSIKDGRFQEQKFRLRKSGIKNVVYIIEEITLSQETATRFQEAVDSAIASTQVVNGYFVKKTQKLDDTIQYLARMTTMLKTLYENKPLHIIPTRILSPPTYLPLLTHLRTTTPLPTHPHITFPAFSSLASKSESLTLRDVFLKMLMCTRGLTGDKALEVQKHWPTPRAFSQAFGRCKDDKEKNEMVWKVCGGLVGRRKIGKALSGKLAEVWGGVGAAGT